MSTSSNMNSPNDSAEVMECPMTACLSAGHKALHAQMFQRPALMSKERHTSAVQTPQRRRHRRRALQLLAKELQQLARHVVECVQGRAGHAQKPDLQCDWQPQARPDRAPNSALVRSAERKELREARAVEAMASLFASL